MRRLARLTAAALFAATLAAPVLAQPGQPATRRTQSAPAEVELPHRVTLDFKGGTLEQLVDALKAASTDRPVNIIYSTEAANIPVPPFEVRDAELYSTIQSLAYASSGSPTTLEDGRVVSWEISRVGDGVYSVYLSTQQRLGPQGQFQASPKLRFTAVHSITELTTGSDAMSADDVLSALQAALAMEDGEDVKLAYHEETGLIFARVTPDQGSVIEQTLVGLRISHEARKDRERRDPLEATLGMVGAADVNDLIAKVNRADQLRNQVLELQRINAEHQNRIIELQDELARYRKSASQRHQDGGGN